MKKFNLMCLGILAGATLAGCSDETLFQDNGQTEAYVRDFIERYGVPDPDHTFSVINRTGVTVKASVPTDVKVTARVGSKEYLFADWKDVSGVQKIDFDLPEGISEVRIYANDRVFNVTAGSTVNLESNQSNSMSREANGFDINTISAKTTITRHQSIPLHGAEGTDDYNFHFPEYFGAVGASNHSVSEYYYNNPDSSDCHNWRSHNGMVPASVLKEFVGNDKDFYSEANGFKKLNYTRIGWTSPSLYIHYIKKSLEFEMGIMVGNVKTLSRSSKLYMLPMFTTEGLPAKNQMYERRQSDSRAGDFKYRGASIVFALESKPFYNDHGTPCNVHIDNNVNQGEETFVWDFTTESYAGVKASIEKVAPLYQKDENGSRPLPLPIDLKDGYTPVEGGCPYEVPAYILGTDEDGNNIYNEDFKFYNKFQTYLRWQLDNVVKKDEKLNAMYDELLWLKEWFVTRGFVFEANDIPEITPYIDAEGKTVEGAYRITYRLAKRIYGGGDYAEINHQTQSEEVYTAFPYQYACYAGLYGGQTFPSRWNGFEYVYYIKNLKTKDIYTTADATMVEMFPYLNVEGKPIYATQSWKCIDVDGDGIPNDIVFDDNTTGGGYSRGIDPYTWLFACEDLGTTGDVDFNDVVMAVSYVSSNSTVTHNVVNIRPLAAGGIYPVYFMYNDLVLDENNNPISTDTYFMGPEIHSWLGSDDYQEMINTGEKDVIGNSNEDKKLEFIYEPAFHGNNQFSLSMASLKNREENGTADSNQSFGGFWVLVDKDNQLAGSDLVPEGITRHKVDQADLWKVATNAHRIVNIAIDENMSVPMIMVVGDDWEWPQETVNITEAYPSWKTWLKQRVGTHWYGLGAETGRYPEDLNRSVVTVRDKVENEINSLNIEDEETEE